MRIQVLIGALAAVLSALPAYAAEPDGLYFMTRYWPNTGLETAGFLFRDGQMARGPGGDIENFDFDAARAKSPGDVATYTISGTQLTASWGDGNTTDSEVEPGDSGCFYWDAGSFCPAEPFSSSTLSGNYEGGVSGNSALGYMQNARDVTFSPDGSYTMDSAAGYSTESSESKISGGASGGESGTYEIDGTLLRMSPQGGEAREIVAFPFGDNISTDHPEWVYFGGTMLKRR